jgi:hypothetical protein
MAITILGATTEGSAASGDITLTAPSSPQTNDIWIAVIHSSDQVAHTFAGWNQIAQDNGGGTTSRISVWYFRYAGSTPNLVVGHTAGQSPIGGILALRGCKTTGSPVNTVSVVGGGTDASIEHTAITPTVARCLILACNGSADDNNRSTPPTGYTPQFEDSAGATQNCYQTTAGNPDGSVAIHTLQQTSAVNTGTITDTQAAADPWASVLVAIEPAADAWTGEIVLVGRCLVDSLNSRSISTFTETRGVGRLVGIIGKLYTIDTNMFGTSDTYVEITVGVFYSVNSCIIGNIFIDTSVDIITQQTTSNFIIGFRYNIFSYAIHYTTL